MNFCVYCQLWLLLNEYWLIDWLNEELKHLIVFCLQVGVCCSKGFENFAALFLSQFCKRLKSGRCFTEVSSNIGSYSRPPPLSRLGAGTERHYTVVKCVVLHKDSQWQNSPEVCIIWQWFRYFSCEYHGCFFLMWRCLITFMILVGIFRMAYRFIQRHVLIPLWLLKCFKC